MVNQLRTLHFASLDQAAREAEALLDRGYQRCGNWSLAQICRHLRLVQDPSLDGYPKWLSLFAFLRPLMRRVLLPRLLSGDAPRGIPTAPMFAPSGDLDDAEEVRKFVASVDRFRRHQGDFAPHPGFGRMNRQSLEEIHAAHAAHHLRFLIPSDGARE